MLSKCKDGGGVIPVCVFSPYPRMYFSHTGPYLVGQITHYPVDSHPFTR
nr:MAG TPA: hypothetical protein [Caudoviricetes sp.]